MLHPRETVVDHTKGQSLGGGSRIQLSLQIVNQLGVAANADIEQNGDQMTLTLRRVEEYLSDRVRENSGLGGVIRNHYKLPVAGAF